ncbi:hypothetical protein U9M48_044146, partial [Paspalum notatum var. saurae]
MAELLAPGFRFYPTEEELVCFYLRNMLYGIRRADIERVIPVVADVCAFDPWQLPGTSSPVVVVHTPSIYTPQSISTTAVDRSNAWFFCLLVSGVVANNDGSIVASMRAEAHRGACSGHGEPWFFFCPRQEREARGGRPSRTTPSGFWKAAGTPGLVYAADGRPIGTKKTMVFYLGRAPAGNNCKTEWKMNEYKALENEHEDSAAAAAAVPAASHALQTRTEFSLCRLYTKTGCPWQFDRRPSTAAAAAGAGGGENAPPAAAALPPNAEQTGQKRKRAASSSSDDTSWSDDGDRTTTQTQGGTGEGLNDGMADW